MLRMDYRLKGFILNHTLKSYTITPIESANVLKVTIRFCGVYKLKSSSKRRRNKLRKEKFLAKFRRDPVLVIIPFLKPGQFPHPVALGGLVHTAITTAFIMQVEEMVDELRGQHHQWDCLAQEADKAEKQREWMSNWVSDLLDQRADVNDELWRLEQDLKRKREELEQLKLEASDLSNACLIVASSVWGLSKGASA